MRPMDDDPEMAALSQLGGQMRRGRFMDALPAEEQEAIKIIISPGGGITIEGGSGDVDMDGQGAELEEDAQERATGAPGALGVSEEDEALQR